MLRGLCPLLLLMPLLVMPLLVLALLLAVPPPESPPPAFATASLRGASPQAVYESMAPAPARPMADSTMADSTMADSTQTHYAQKDVRALRQLFEKADTRAQRLLCRYRLYPLTEDEHYLDDLPEDLGANATAREMALLSGLWGYRAARASLFGAMQAGRRSMNLLEKARTKDPDGLFVLLISGQSLLFRPAVAGGSDEEALQRFQRLRQVLDEHAPPVPPVSSTEAALWTWYALRETSRTDEADALHQQLAARDLPPLYREFLRHPPG